MAASSLSLNWVSPAFSKKEQINAPCSNGLPRVTAAPVGNNRTTCKSQQKTLSDGESNCKRRQLVMQGIAALTSSLLPADSVFAQEIPKNYTAFVDRKDGYSYYYPSDWRDFDFLGHDSAFRDRYLPMQHVKVRFIPTDKKDVHDLGPKEQVISDLVRHVYAAPNQRATIFDMQERSEDGKTYYTFEYEFTSPNYSSTHFTTIAIANGRYYTLVVVANERRWRRVRNKLKVVADSFKVLDI